MRESDRYNGWTNWETWNFKLWLDNDVATYNHFQEFAKVTLEDDKIEFKISDVEKYLREYAEDEIDNYIEGKEMGWINDFINMSKCEIDFHDIALHILKDEGYKE